MVLCMVYYGAFIVAKYRCCLFWHWFFRQNSFFGAIFTTATLKNSIHILKKGNFYKQWIWSVTKWNVNNPKYSDHLIFKNQIVCAIWHFHRIGIKCFRKNRLNDQQSQQMLKINVWHERDKSEWNLCVNDFSKNDTDFYLYCYCHFGCRLWILVPILAFVYNKIVNFCV